MPSIASMGWPTRTLASTAVGGCTDGAWNGSSGHLLVARPHAEDHRLQLEFGDRCAHDIDHWDSAHPHW